MTNVMSKTKRIVALLLALLMMLSVVLVSCDESYDDDDDDTYDKADKDDDSDEKAKFSRGETDEDIYNNKYLGFKFEKPKSWIYSTDEEIAELLNISVETFFDDKFKEALDKSGSIYDMMARDTITGANVIVGYENLSKTYSTNITEEQYADAVKVNIAQAMGMEFEFDEYETVKLGKTEFLRVSGNTTYNGSSMIQAYYLHKVDGYMAFVVVTVPRGYTLNEIEGMLK